ncbi:hypothetical protein Tco_1015416 [Tanacetum coccineum]|uniref:Gag-Pol polyprotein n=1 Tax=Tanacetum coccineum TaxID=301880 RepID=A0ABQ5FKQ7_9ASTR
MEESLLSNSFTSLAPSATLSEMTTSLEQNSLGHDLQSQENVPLADETVTTSLNELDMLFSPMFDEYFNGATLVVSKSSIVPTTDAFDKHNPLEQIIGNPSQPVRTRRQLEIDGKMCMFALTVSHTEPKNIKEAMADHAWIEAMQEELHQFERLDVWELVDKPLCKNVKCKYATRNTGKGRKNEENTDSYEALWRNPYDSVTP